MRRIGLAVKNPARFDDRQPGYRVTRQTMLADL
jgi:hypothetical protein